MYAIFTRSSSKLRNWLWSCIGIPFFTLKSVYFDFVDDLVIYEFLNYAADLVIFSSIYGFSSPWFFLTFLLHVSIATANEINMMNFLFASLGDLDYPANFFFFLSCKIFALVHAVFILSDICRYNQLYNQSNTWIILYLTSCNTVP